MTELVSFFLVSLSAVFLIVDPIGCVPIFLAMTANDPPAKVRRMALRACVAGAGILIFFALFGGVIFRIFGLTLGAFRVAGGLLLLMTARDMLNARPATTRTSPTETLEGAQKEDVAIVPMAIPLLAGPGAIATVMVLMSKGTSVIGGTTVVVCILITFVASYFLLRGATLVQQVLRQSGVAILERVMGLILAAIAVQFIAEGGRALLFPGA
ncbi:MAG: NAAT family transporter [Myxococcaceae bacterium]|nr:NAAT family transporter [Myxococcaceae bacterium]